MNQFSFVSGEEAIEGQMIVLANDSNGETCGAGTILGFDTKTADYPHATVKWDSDGKVERVLLEDLALAPVTEADSFDLYEAEWRDYHRNPAPLH